MNKPVVNIAVIGTGGMANSVHIPSLKEIEGVNLVAGCDLRPERVRATCERFGIPHVYWNMYEMFEKEDLDGAVILTEPDRIFRTAQDTMRAGIPCMIEKPAGISAHQARFLAKISEETGMMCTVAMNRRYIPLVNKVLAHMKEVTAVTQVDGVFIKNSDLGSAWEYATAFGTDFIHAIDLIRYLAGSEVDKAATVTGRFSGCPVDNAWSSVMRFKNGVTGTLKANYQTGGRVHAFEIHGPGASAFINLGFGGPKCEATILYHSGNAMYSMAAAGVSGQSSAHIDGIALAGSDQYYAYYGYKQENEDFVRYLQTGQQPLCTIADATGSMELFEVLLACAI